MEIKEFLEKFLPDYEVRHKYHIEKWTVSTPNGAHTLFEWKFICEYFPKALQNFVDRICEEQKGIVLSDFVNYVMVTDNSKITANERDCILRAKQPKLEDL
ncbi:MAG: hypothetical protein LBN27_02000 [Prevotellaceae bacterium]|jgi:hypothetical protein|nr:hypothetical protein [Prevotellaceae bacterium]